MKGGTTFLSKIFLSCKLILDFEMAFLSAILPKKIMVDSNDPSSLASFPLSEEESDHFPYHEIHVFIGETKVSFYLMAINSSYKVESLLEILLMLSNTKVGYNMGFFSNFPYRIRHLIITYLDTPLLTMFKFISPSSPMGWGS
jgi:hypothetical protein